MLKNLDKIYILLIGFSLLIIIILFFFMDGHNKHRYCIRDNSGVFYLTDEINYRENDCIEFLTKKGKKIKICGNFTIEQSK